MVSPGARPSQGLGCAGPQPLLLEELAGALLDEGASELLDSRKDEIASASELLMGSWLSGISTALLELLFCDSGCLEVSCVVSAGSEPLCCAPVCLVLLTVVALSEVGLDSSDGLLSTVLLSSEDSGSASMGKATWPEVALELSSQAFSVNAAVMPSVAASALLAATEKDFVSVTFFFSIFIFQPFGVFSGISLGLDVVAFEGGDHAAHRSADAIGAEVYLATNVYGRASRKPTARVVDVPDGGLAGRRTCRIGGFA